MAGGVLVLDQPRGLVSTGNASTTALGAAGTYTGTAEQNFFPDVMVSCYSDVAGTLYFDFAINDTDWRPFPSNGFVVSAGVHEFHVAVKGPRYFRVRYVNGASAQSTFQLQTYYGTFDAPNAPISQTLGSDADARVVRVFPEGIDLALGKLGGVQEDTKFGHVENIDAADNPVDVWAIAEDGLSDRLDQKTFPTSAATLYMASTDNADTAEITVEYIDADGYSQTVTADLTGNTAVNLGVTGLDVNRAYLSGDSQTHAGAIYIANNSAFGGTTAGVPSTIANTLACIPADYGQTHQCLYTVPADKTCRIKKFHIGVSRASGAAGSAELHFLIKQPSGSWRTVREFHFQTGFVTKDVAGIVLSPGAKFRMVVQDVSDLDTNVSAEVAYDLIEA